MADGTEPVDQIFAKGQCVACHTIPGIAGAIGTIGPKLVEGTNAPLRIKDKEYKGKAKASLNTLWNPLLSLVPMS